MIFVTGVILAILGGIVYGIAEGAANNCTERCWIAYAFVVIGGLTVLAGFICMAASILILIVRWMP